MGGSRILIVEDDGIIGRHIQNTLQKLGYQVLDVVFSGDTAIKISAEEHPDLVLMDINLEGELDGVDAAGQIYGRLGIPVVYLTAFADNDILQRAKITDPFGYILKPFEERSLHSTIEMALRKKESEKVADEQRALAEALRDTAAVLTSTLDLNEVFDRIMTNIGRVVPHEGTTIMLVEGDEARIVRSRGYAEYDLQGAIQQTRFSISATPNLRWMAETGNPLAIPVLALYEGWISVFPASWVRSGASAPIQIKGKLLGFLTLDSAQEGFFNQTHADRLKAFADQAAIAIENARLYEESQQRARFLALLNEITHLALSATNLVDMTQTLAAYMADLFEADQVYIETWDEAQQLTKTVASYAASHKAPHSRLFKPGERTFTYSILEAGSALAVTNISETPYIDPELSSNYMHAAMLGLPLMAGGQKLGAVIIGYNLPHSFRPEEINWGEQAAGQIALAVANARLLEVERQKTAELTHANNLITALGHVATRIEIVPDPDRVMETLGKELQRIGLSCVLVQNDPVSRLPAVRSISIQSTEDKIQSDDHHDGPSKLQEFQEILWKSKILDELVKTRQAIYYPDLLDSVYRLTSELIPGSMEQLLDLVGITAKTKAIALPLIIGEKAAAESILEGGLLVIWGNHLKENDLAALSVFASQVAITLENARLLSKVQQLAITDDLTGLYNRRGIFELGQEEVKRALSSTHLPSLILMDVDFFKKVNDTYGHDTGDEVIRAIALICRNNLRDIDLVGRYGGEGGDEFVILLPATDLAAASQVAERLRQVISEDPIKTEKSNISVTVSLGVTSMANEGSLRERTVEGCLRDGSTQDWAALLNRADQAMYMAKSMGRNRVVAK
jgi:diguanylate cyclase (GGDEF)-like protein